MKKGKKRFVSLCVIVSIVAVAFCVYRLQKKSQDDDLIRIGAILPLTGAGSIAGTYVQQALLFAQGQIALNGGPNYEVIIEDSKSNPKDAVLAYRKLISDKAIKVVFLQMSSVIQTIVPLSEHDDVLLIGIGSIEPRVDRDSPRQYVINYLDASTQAKIFLDNSKDRVTLFYLNDDYGMSIKVALENQAHSLTKQVHSYAFSISSHAQDIVATVPLDSDESVVIAGYGPIMVEIAERLLQRGFQGNILCTPELLVNANLSRLKDVGANLYVIGMKMLSGPIAERFLDAYGREASVADMLAYNGMICVDEAVETAGKDDSFSAKQLLKSLVNLTRFNNAIGVSRVTEHCFVYDAYMEKVFNDE